MSPTNQEQTLRMHLLVGSYADVEHEVKRVVEGCFGRHGEYTYSLSKFESNIDYVDEGGFGEPVYYVPTITSYTVTATAKWIPA